MTVFISHASDDVALATALADALEQEGIPTWLAARGGVPVGANYAAEITKALVGCRAVVVVVSEASVNSVNVRRELNLAIDEDKLVLPVALNQQMLVMRDLPMDWRYWLSLVQILPMTSMPELVDEIGRRLNADERTRRDAPTKQMIGAHASHAAGESQPQIGAATVAGSPVGGRVIEESDSPLRTGSAEVDNGGGRAQDGGNRSRGTKIAVASVAAASVVAAASLAVMLVSDSGNKPPVVVAVASSAVATPEAQSQSTPSSAPPPQPAAADTNQAQAAATPSAAGSWSGEMISEEWIYDIDMDITESPDGSLKARARQVERTAADGLLTGQSGTEVLTGLRSGSKVSLRGEYFEPGAPPSWLVDTMDLTLSSDGSSMNGTYTCDQCPTNAMSLRRE